MFTLLTCKLQIFISFVGCIMVFPYRTFLDNLTNGFFRVPRLLESVVEQRCCIYFQFTYAIRKNLCDILMKSQRWKRCRLEKERASAKCEHCSCSLQIFCAWSFAFLTYMNDITQASLFTITFLLIILIWICLHPILKLYNELQNIDKWIRANK